MTKTPAFIQSLFTICIISFLFSCQTQTEDARFETFLTTHQKAFAKHLPEGKYDFLSEEFDSKTTDAEVFRDVQFCNEQLDKLAKFDLRELSEENREKWKATFEKLKGQLAKIEAVSKREL